MFNVIQNVVEACDRALNTNSGTDTGERDTVERKRWMWLKKLTSGTEKEVWERDPLAQERCAEGNAHEIMLVLQVINQWKDAREAEKLLLN